MTGLVTLAGGIILLMLGCALALWDALAPVTGPREGWRDSNLLTRTRSTLDRVYSCNYSPAELLDLAAECDRQGQGQQAEQLRDLAFVQTLRARLEPVPSHVRPLSLIHI